METEQQPINKRPAKKKKKGARGKIQPPIDMGYSYDYNGNIISPAYQVSRVPLPAARSREICRPASALSSGNNSFTSILTAEERPPSDSRHRQHHDFPRASNNFAQYNVPLRDNRAHYNAPPGPH